MRIGKLGKLALSMVAMPLCQACSDLRGGARTFEVRAEVSSGDQVFTGAGVRTLSFERRFQISSETPPIVWAEAGEAIVVPLHGGQALYVLLDGREFPTGTVAKLARPRRDENLLSAIERAMSEGRSGALTQYEYVDVHDKFRWPYPRMAYFPDPADHSILHIVEPGGRFSVDGRDYQVTAVWIDEPQVPESKASIPAVGEYDMGIEVRSTNPGEHFTFAHPSVFPSNFSSRQLKSK